MAAVEYDDDNRLRFVVRRYAFDPERNERRHVVVAVVDNEAEFENLLNRLNDELRQRRAAGEHVDPREHVSGDVLEPGHLARAANGHLVKRAIKHGVFPEQLLSIELPSNMAFHTSQNTPRPPRFLPAVAARILGALRHRRRGR